MDAKLKTTIMFDLGGTLAHYYTMSDFPSILERAVGQVQALLQEKQIFTLSPDDVPRRVKEEDHESPDYRSRPLEDRLTRIFDLDAKVVTGELLMEVCRRFMAPIFSRGKCYEDTLPALQELKRRGFRTAIVSNTSWGSPSLLWREEVKRLSLDSYMDSVVLDRDVGWRKPAKRIFEHTLQSLGVSAGECVFVGDEPKWDITGPRNAGIDAVLIDRCEVHSNLREEAIKDLRSLGSMLKGPEG